ncbi:MAG: TRAP transporter small permease subunit [Alphaproteobacteria bacterium]|nr:TRAP transporter small permease subunit [Alphaproteobacteria bacterium]
MLLHYIRTVCVVIGCFALAAVVVLPASQIVLRELGAPFIGMEELARYFMIVVTFVGIPLVNHEGGHIRMDEIHRFIPIPASAVLRVIIAIVSGTAFGIVVVAIYSSVRITMGSSTPTLGIPFWLFNAPALLGLSLGAVEFFLQAWRIARGRNDSAAPRLV